MKRFRTTFPDAAPDSLSDGVSSSTEPKHTPAGRSEGGAATSSSSNSYASVHDLSAGDRVTHERFGSGTIIAIEGNPPDTTAVVDFTGSGRKKLLLRFAKLTRR
jgi:DNA helicase-2/ATP-dependent DNA helicase PcrA